MNKNPQEKNPNPELINVTELTEYLYCPRKLYLKKIKQIREPFTLPMLRGMLKHKILDYFNRDEPEMIQSIQSQLSEKEVEALYKLLLEQKVHKVLTKHKSQIANFKLNTSDFYNELLEKSSLDIKEKSNSCYRFLCLGFLGQSLWKNITPKFQTELQLISESLELKGRIDKVEITDSKIIPYEIKTRQDIFESDKIQLAAYALLLESEFNKQISSGIIQSESKKEEIQINKELKDKVIEIKNQIKQLSSFDSVPEMQSNFKKCESCSLKKICLEVE